MSSSILHKPVATVNDMSLYYHGEVAVIVIDRGENRVNKEFVAGFNQLLDQVESKDSCKGLITTGKGKFYSNGLDLARFANLPMEEVTVTLFQFVQLLKRLLMFPIPTLAALNGHTFAGGGLLAFVHDLRTMRTNKGWISFNEVFINRQFGNFNLKMLEMKLGKGRNLSDAVVLGKRFTSNEALQSGLVHSIQPENMLLIESIHVLKSFYMQGYARESLQAMKEDVYVEVLKVYREEKIEEGLENAKQGILPSKSRL